MNQAKRVPQPFGAVIVRHRQRLGSVSDHATRNARNRAFGRFPFGLMIAMKIVPQWRHAESPALTWPPQLEQIRASTLTPNRFPDAGRLYSAWNTVEGRM